MVVFFKCLNLRGEMWLCSILLRRDVVYFLRANIKGEVWLIKFSRKDMVVCQM